MDMHACTEDLTGCLSRKAYLESLPLVVFLYCAEVFDRHPPLLKPLAMSGSGGQQWGASDQESAACKGMPLR